MIPGKNLQSGGMKSKRDPLELNWRKKRIFFELPYWEDQVLKHNLDVMHIEMNVCDNLLGTLLSIPRKSKDTDKAQLKSEDINICSELHMKKQGSRWVKY